LFPLFQGQLIGATIKITPDPAYGARVGINGLLAFSLGFEHAPVTLIKYIQSIGFGLIHGTPPLVLLVLDIEHNPFYTRNMRKILPLLPQLCLEK
jgi:hypothetical protein